MALSEDVKAKLRKTIESELEKVPEGMKIKLDNQLLDELIFFYGKFSQDAEFNKGKTFKVPVWTGKFLSKLDLSGISFENAWLGYYPDMDRDNIDDETLSRMRSGHDTEYEMPYIYDKRGTEDICNQIDLSNTNIKIDFGKLFTSEICHCNLSGVDLSQANIQAISMIEISDFSNTNIKFDDLMKTGNRFDANFSNNDFSQDVISIDKLVDIDALGYVIHQNSSYMNTGLQIIYSKKDIPAKYANLISQGPKNLNCETFASWLGNQLEEYPELKQYLFELQIQKYLMKELESGTFEGCYINGMLIDQDTKLENIPSYDEYQKAKEEKNNTMADYFMDNIASIIDNQITSFSDDSNQIDEDTSKHF